MFKGQKKSKKESGIGKFRKKQDYRSCTKTEKSGTITISEERKVLRAVFGMNLKYHRTRQGLTQEEAAARCKISSEYWGKMERGAQAATVDTIEKVSVGLNINARDLFNESIS